MFIKYVKIMPNIYKTLDIEAHHTV